MLLTLAAQSLTYDNIMHSICFSNLDGAHEEFGVESRERRTSAAALLDIRDAKFTHTCDPEITTLNAC